MSSSSSPLLRCSEVACQRKKGWLEADIDLHAMLPPPPASPVDRLSSIRCSVELIFVPPGSLVPSIPSIL